MTLKPLKRQINRATDNAPHELGLGNKEPPILHTPHAGSKPLLGTYVNTRMLNNQRCMMNGDENASQTICSMQSKTHGGELAFANALRKQ